MGKHWAAVEQTWDPYTLTLAEVEQVNLAVFLPKLLPGFLAFDAVSRLGLGVFYDRAREHYLIGFVSPLVHDHDRWIFARQAHKMDSWQIVSTHYDARNVGAKLPLSYESPAGVAWYLDTFEGLVSEAQELRRDHGMTVIADTHLMRYTSVLNLHDSELLYRLGGGEDVADLHDLLHHEAKWRAQHPEVADVPLTLLLRMRGLGGILDAGYTPKI